MSQTISNDYVSMINKRGSGYDIPEIVDAIVAAEIEPVKEIVTAQKEQVGASISGMSVLKSSMLATQTLVNSMSSGSLFTSNHSPNSNYMRSTIVDQASLKEGSNLFENVVIAKPQIWRADGETAIADQTITIEFGNNGANDGGWTPSSPVRSADVVLSGDTLVSAVAKLNNVTGLTAEIVQLDSNSSEYSVVLTSETGAKNGFKMTNNAGTLWKTDNGTGDFFQQSLDATFDLNGQSYSRSSNNITDIIPGLQVELLSSRTDEQSITVTKSSESIQKIVETLIADLNAYKSDLNTLGFIDEAGDEDGELVNSSFLRIAKQRFARLMTEPITGFGDTNIYFVDFGIKTGKDGSLLFDQKSFNRTYSNTPEKFDALTQDKVYSSDPLSTPTSLPDSGLPPGKYEYRQSSETLFSFNTSQSLATSVSGSGTDYRRSADEYIGFSLNTYHSNPTDYDIYVGHSAKTKINNFFADALSDSGNLDATVDFYKDRDLSLDARLTKIDKREALLQAQYTKRFAAMEKVVNASTSSAEYVTQLVDGWNKS
ncbi:MAG: flagellar filament capping protein FliD [Bacteroidetes bacterium]|jgi:flagellar hook-associated protein 2|nr:flagellar filament capping protein FliD [Betaproteobacteria bacterium]MBT6366391.1 flagellar filament capping protein FliD [Bacteroidota bacterium]